MSAQVINNEKPKYNILRNALWVTFSNILGRGFTFISSIIVARILFPEDFGVISMAATFSNFIDYSSKMGIDAFLISQKDASEKDINTVNLLNILIGIIFASIMIVGAPIAADFYKTPEIQQVLLFSGLSFLIVSFFRIPRALIIKAMKQNIVAKVEIIQNLINSVLIVIFALNGFRYLSFVIPMLITNVIVFIIYFFLSRVKYSTKIEKSTLKNSLTYSKSFLPKMVLTYIVYNSDYIFIGYLLGSKLLGFYFFGFEKALILLGIMTNIGVTTFFPLFAKVQSDLKELKTTYLNVVEKQNFILFPVLFLQIILAKELIHFIYGVKWDNSVLTFQLILAYAFSRCYNSVILVLFDAVGKPQENLKHMKIVTPLCMVVLFTGVKLGGLVGASIAAFVFHTFTSLLLLFRLSIFFNWNYKELLSNSYMPLAPLIVQLPILIPLKNMLNLLNVPHFWILSTISIFCFCLYLLICRFFFKNLYNQNFQPLKEKFINKIKNKTNRELKYENV